MDESCLHDGGIRHEDSNQPSSIARLLGSQKHKRNLLVKAPTRPTGRQPQESQEELRRHVRAVTMGDERPLPVVVLAPTRNECNPQQDRIHRRSADLG